MRYFDIVAPAELMERGQELNLAVPLERFIEDPGYVYIKWTARDTTQILKIERFSGDMWRYHQTDGEPSIPADML